MVRMVMDGWSSLNAHKSVIEIQMEMSFVSKDQLKIALRVL